MVLYTSDGEIPVIDITMPDPHGAVAPRFNVNLSEMGYDRLRSYGLSEVLKNNVGIDIRQFETGQQHTIYLLKQHLRLVIRCEVRQSDHEHRYSFHLYDSNNNLLSTIVAPQTSPPLWILAEDPPPYPPEPPKRDVDLYLFHITNTADYEYEDMVFFAGENFTQGDMIAILQPSWYDEGEIEDDFPTNEIIISRYLFPEIKKTIPEPDDPSEGGGSIPTEGTSTGGSRNKNRQLGLTVTPPNAPLYSVLNKGLFNTYKMSQTIMSSLLEYLWSGGWDTDSFKKIINSPMDAILSTMLLPFDVGASTTTDSITFGNMRTGIYTYRVLVQYQTVSCGSVTIEPFWDAFLDCSPYTKIELYLPYIGNVSVSPDDILQLSNNSLSSGSLSVNYVVDVLTGGCIAMVSVNGMLIGEYSGNCGVPIPITGNSYNSMVSGISGLIKSGVGFVSSVATDNVVGAVGSAVSAIDSVISGSKMSYDHSGNSSPLTAFMGSQKPYVIITRPWVSNPVDYGAYKGYTSNITTTLSSLVGQGFTVIDEIHLQGIDCTSDEYDEIERLLKEGVVL